MTHHLSTFSPLGKEKWPTRACRTSPIYSRLLQRNRSQRHSRRNLVARESLSLLHNNIVTRALVSLPLNNDKVQHLHSLRQSLLIFSWNLACKSEMERVAVRECRHVGVERWLYLQVKMTSFRMTRTCAMIGWNADTGNNNNINRTSLLCIHLSTAV